MRHVFAGFHSMKFIQNFLVEFELKSVRFSEEPQNPEKNPRSKDGNQQQGQPTYDSGSLNHIDGRRMLSPLHHISSLAGIVAYCRVSPQHYIRRYYETNVLPKGHNKKSSFCFTPDNTLQKG